MHVVVIGAGPAGAAAAITLAPHASVTLLHRPQPRPRPGETQPPGVEPILRQLGVWSQAVQHCTARQPGHWVLERTCSRFVPYGEDSDGPWLNLQIDGADLDTALRRRAVELGATLLEVDKVQLRPDGDRVGVVADGRALDGFVIDASGRAQVLARALGLPVLHASPPLVARFGWCEGGDIEHPNAPTFAGDRDGWTWVAPLGRSRWAWTRVDLERGHRAATWQPAVLDTLPMRSPPRGLDVRWSLVPACAGRGYAIVGDAAATLDPALGHGVLKGMMTGIMAGTLAPQIVGGAAPPQAYQRWLASWFRSDAAELLTAYRAMAPEHTWVQTLARTMHAALVE